MGAHLVRRKWLAAGALILLYVGFSAYMSIYAPNPWSIEPSVVDLAPLAERANPIGLGPEYGCNAVMKVTNYQNTSIQVTSPHGLPLAAYDWRGTPICGYSIEYIAGRESTNMAFWLTIQVLLAACYWLGWRRGRRLKVTRR